MPKIEFDYYYGAESEQFSFVRVPRVLFTDKEHFGDLSNDAKLLYGLLLDRMSLSRRNNWFDEQNRVYIVFTIDEIEDMLDVTTAAMPMNEGEFLDVERYLDVKRRNIFWQGCTISGRYCRRISGSKICRTVRYASR